jgi:hypothetical protein
MKKLVLLPLLFLLVSASANDTTYFAVLRSSLLPADQEYRFTTYQNLANTCDRIIAMREQEWLPMYYRAYAYTHLAYMTADEEKKDALLDEAQASADAALIMNPGESEIQLVLALICYGRMEINPMFRATIYFPKANAALERAEELNPANPRIYYLEAKTTMYKPAFMGGGAEAALPLLTKSLQCFRNIKLPFDLYPHWGEEDTFALYKECKKIIQEE